MTQCLYEHSSARLAIVQGRNTSGRSNATMLLDGGMPGSAAGPVALRRSRAPRCCTTRRCTARARADAWHQGPELGSSVVTIPSSTLLPACLFVLTLVRPKRARERGFRAGPNRSARRRGRKRNHFTFDNRNGRTWQFLRDASSRLLTTEFRAPREAVFHC